MRSSHHIMRGVGGGHQRVILKLSRGNHLVGADCIGMEVESILRLLVGRILPSQGASPHPGRIAQLVIESFVAGEYGPVGRVAQLDIADSPAESAFAVVEKRIAGEGVSVAGLYKRAAEKVGLLVFGIICAVGGIDCAVARYDCRGSVEGGHMRQGAVQHLVGIDVESVVGA